MKVKKVFKYATGENIPEGAVYLSTQVETKSYVTSEGVSYTITEKEYVWHYFLVEVEEQNA